MFDEFIVKGEEYGHKVGRTLAYRVDERRNMINDYQRGGELVLRVLVGVEFRGSADFEHLLWFWVFLLFWAFTSSYLPFWLALPLFMLFVGFCGFSSFRWPSWVFLGFLGLLAVLHGVLDSNFKLCAFIVNGLIKEDIEKLSGQFLGLIVMSHWLGEVWIQIQHSFILFFFYFCFVWRITFACLVVCRWQVWHDVHRRWSWQE
jgi:hypothetical protein